MVKYLKKKKMYELVAQLLKDKKLPLMKACEYKFYQGVENLSFTGIGEDYHWYKVSSQLCGGWIQIEEFGYRGEDIVTFRTDIYAELKDGAYQYHSVSELDKEM